MAAIEDLDLHLKDIELGIKQNKHIINRIQANIENTNDSSNHDATNKKDYPVAISIIIPIYNVEPYLEKRIKSVINQSIKNIELICINDGSTDDCSDILKKICS